MTRLRRSLLGLVLSAALSAPALAAPQGSPTFETPHDFKTLVRTRCSW